MTSGIHILCIHVFQCFSYRGRCFQFTRNMVPYPCMFPLNLQVMLYISGKKHFLGKLVTSTVISISIVRHMYSDMPIYLGILCRYTYLSSGYLPLKPTTCSVIMCNDKAVCMTTSGKLHSRVANNEFLTTPTLRFSNDHFILGKKNCGTYKKTQRAITSKLEGNHKRG